MSEKNSTRGCLIWCWFAQLLLWAAMIFMIVTYVAEDENSQGGAIVFLVCAYLNYVLSNACSPMCRYLFNKHGSNSIHGHMKDLFYSYPTIKWHVECYHHETRHHSHKDANGDSKHHTTSKKVTTYTETRDFKYYTWRDISGLFLLDSQNVYRGDKKVFIKLELEMDIQLADDLTRMDYQRQKDEFYMMNKYRDTHISFSESKDISGFTPYNLVRISDYDPPGVSRCAFFFFMFVFPFLEFYKMYVDQYCIDQKYEIKKVVSTRFNLNEQQHAQPYIGFVPAMVIFNQPRVAFEEVSQPLHNTPILPTMEELEEAKRINQQHKVNFNFQANDNYSPIFTGVPSNVPLQGMNNNVLLPVQNNQNQSGGMMTNYSEPMVNNGGMMTSEPMMNQGGMVFTSFEPMVNNDAKLNVGNNDLKQKLI